MTETDQQAVAATPPQLATWHGLTLAHLWAVVALAGVGLLLSLTRTVPNDLWWHVKIGELIATTGQIPTTNIFAWTVPADAPFVYQSWLGELLYYLTYQLGGWNMTIFTRNMLGLVAYALVVLDARLRTGSWQLASAAVILAALMAINNWTTRTQNWSWIPFAVQMVVLSSYASNRLSPRWLVLLPLQMAFWVNAHGGFMLGILMMGAYVVGETLRRVLRQPYALSWQRLKPLYYAGAAMIVATVVNPLGVGVFAYVLDLLTDAPSQSLVSEWQPPDPESFPGFFFIVSVLLMLAAFAFGRRRPTITDVLLVCGFGWMAFNGVRYVMWYGMIAMPILVSVLVAPRAAAAVQGARAAPRRPRGNPVINAVLAVAMLLPLVVVQPWLKPLLPLPATYTDQFAPVPGAPLLFSNTTPVAATDHLREQPCMGNLFNENGYGSYLIWELGTAAPVFVDPRFELYPLTIWEDYIDITRGGDPARALLDEYAIACVMLDTELQPRLTETMPTLAGWQRTFGNEQSEVWRRAN